MWKGLVRGQWVTEPKSIDYIYITRTSVDYPKKFDFYFISNKSVILKSQDQSVFLETFQNWRPDPVLLQLCSSGFCSSFNFILLATHARILEAILAPVSFLVSPSLKKISKLHLKCILRISMLIPFHCYQVNIMNFWIMAIAY